MKSKEELNALKEEVEALNRKLAELSEEDLEQVTGGFGFDHDNGKLDLKLSGDEFVHSSFPSIHY